jgi:hypothetical protein
MSEPKGSWERGFKEGKAKSVFDLEHANERISGAVALLRRVKLWRDSPSNDCFPVDLLDDIDAFLKQRKPK